MKTIRFYFWQSKACSFNQLKMWRPTKEWEHLSYRYYRPTGARGATAAIQTGVTGYRNPHHQPDNQH